MRLSACALAQSVDVEEEHIMMLDTDMFIRAPVDPVALGVRRQFRG